MSSSTVGVFLGGGCDCRIANFLHRTFSNKSLWSIPSTVRNMFHHLAIDIYVKHVPVLLHMTAAVLWGHCSWKIIFSKGLAFYGGLRWDRFLLGWGRCSWRRSWVICLCSPKWRPFILILVEGCPWILIIIDLAEVRGPVPQLFSCEGFRKTHRRCRFVDLFIREGEQLDKGNWQSFQFWWSIPHRGHALRASSLHLGLVVLATHNVTDVKHMHDRHEIPQHLRAILFSFKGMEIVTKFQAGGQFVVCNPPSQPVILWEGFLNRSMKVVKIMLRPYTRWPGSLTKAAWSTPSSSNCLFHHSTLPFTLVMISSQSPLWSQIGSGSTPYSPQISLPDQTIREITRIWDP